MRVSHAGKLPALCFKHANALADEALRYRHRQSGIGVCGRCVSRQAEAAFRTSKSDLALRPVYHQKIERFESPHPGLFFGPGTLVHSGNVDAFQGTGNLRSSTLVRSLHHPFHGRGHSSQKPCSTAHAPGRPTRQTSGRIASALGLGAADVTTNHPKCSGKNRLKSPAKPPKCYTCRDNSGLRLGMFGIEV
jgi:hypothetical protein